MPCANGKNQIKFRYKSRDYSFFAASLLKLLELFYSRGWIYAERML